MLKIKDFLRKYKNIYLIAGLALLCWGSLLRLRGFWWDDWAWVWHYFGSSNLSEFIQPFKSLRHELDGCLLYLNFRLLDMSPEFATGIWNVFKSIIFVINSLLLYLLLKSVLNDGSVLPKAIAVVYLVSPLVNNLCLTEFVRRLYLCSFLLSVLLSVKAVSKSTLRAPYYLLAVFLSLFSMVGLESFVFFDLARPIIVFYILFKKLENTFSTALKKALLYWLPFILIGACVLVRATGSLTPRTGIYADTYKFQFKHIFEIACNYITSLRFLFVDNISHFVRGVSFIERDFILIIAALTAAIFAVLIIRKKKNNDIQDNDLSNEATLVTVFGAFLIIVGLFPHIMVRGVPYFGVGSRRALEASVGVAIFIPSFLFTLYYKGFINKQFCYFLLGGVVFLGVFQCNMAVRAYQNDWQQQRSFWWQFIWRVPDIKNNTYLLVDMPREEKDYFDVWRGIYEFSCPLNLLYAKSKDKKEINNHFAQSFDLTAFQSSFGELYYPNHMDKDKVDFESYKGTIQFYPRKLIVASYHKGYLYLNQEVNKSNSSQTVNMEPIVSNVSADQIRYENSGEIFPFRWIIGPEPLRSDCATVMGRTAEKIFHENVTLKDWRYYWQKAKVLEREKNYEETTSLYDEAEKSGVVPPAFPMPLFIIKAFYVTGKVDKGNYLLRRWAFSADGNLEEALALLESIKRLNNDKELYLEIEKEVKRIWHQKDEK